MNMKSMSILGLLVLVATLVSARRPTHSSQLSRRPRLAFLGVGLPQSSTKTIIPTSTDFTPSIIRTSSIIMYNQPPRRTRENEPDEYFQTNLDKVPVKERFSDPLVIIILAGLLVPFIAVGIIIQSGLLTQ